MGTAYTRQSSFTDGDTINANLFNNEFDKLVEAFNVSTGHTHDGTAGEGSAITKVGPTQDIIVSGTAVLPKTNNAIDLGSSTYKFKNAHFAGNITADGSITYNGNVVLGSDSTDTITINGTIQGSSLVFEGSTADAYELTLAIPNATADVTVTLPNATDTLVGRATTDTLTNKTITSPIINTPTITGNTTFSDGAYDFDIASHDGTNGLKLGGTLVTSSATELNLLDGITAIKDEDNMASDSATSLATQQSIKAYVDSQISSNNELNEVTDVTITSVADNEVLAYDSTTSKWINQTATEAGLQPLSSVLTNTTASYTTAEETKLAGIETAATADQTGAEIKSLYEAEANTNAFTDAEKTKLSGIETGADVTDATNVDAAGAVMNTDTATTSMQFVIDEDTMSSDSATKVPTQQSVKAYVDSQVASKDALSELSGTSDDITEGTTNLFFTSAEQTKLSGIETGATADQTAQEIATAIDADATAETTLKSALGLGTAAYTASTDYATAAQGALADSAVQNLSDLSITATATELNYSSGVTSNIQTQLDTKEALGASVAMAIALGG